MSYHSIPKKIRHKFNEQKISNLDKSDISIISNTLEENHVILSFFGYKPFNQ